MRYLIVSIILLLSIKLKSQSDLPEISKYEAKFESIFTFIKNNDTIIAASKSYLENSLDSAANEPLLKNYLKLLLARTYRKENPKRSNELLDEVKLFLKQNKYYIHLQLTYNVIKARILYEINQDCKSSYNLYQENSPKLAFYKSLDKYWNIENETKTGLILSLLCLGKDQQALDSLKIFEKEINPIENLKEYVFALSTIGYIHTKFKNYKDGTIYFKKVIELLEDNKDLVSNYFAALNNLAYIYRTTERYSESIELLQKGLKKARSVNDVNNTLLITNNLGFNFLQIKNYKSAALLGEQALSKSISNEYKFHKANANRLLGHTYYFTGDYHKSEMHIDSAISYYRNIKQIENYRNCLNIKAKLYLIKKDYAAASIINNEIIGLLDSVNLSKQYESLQKNLVEYESEKKDAEITILSQKDEINALKIKQQNLSIRYLVAGVLLLTTLALIVVIYQRRINKINTLTLRSKLARAQFNPHFINNALAGIQINLLDYNDENLINHVSSVSKLTRYILESTFREEWTLSEEIQLINLYIESQQYRLKNSFDFNFKIELNQESLNTYMIPSAITQIPLENTIIHGGYDKNNGGKIELTLSLKEKSICISITNNILAPESSKVMSKPKDSTSRGLELTKKRIETHCKIHNSEGNTSIIIENEAARVEMLLPIIVSKTT
ncbi:MAG: tetratricopeptide repeat protein [Bacteroidetes bacterium]|nr:tetratricopeptide repeat protein [Bacteroidota bacterium]